MDTRLQRIKALQERSRELTAELERSLKIQALWPEAFALGPCTSRVVGPVQPRSKAELRVIVRRPDGEERSFTMEQWG